MVFWRVAENAYCCKSRLEDGRWSTPLPLGAAANPGPMQITPSLSADGTRLTFASDAPRDGKTAGLFDLHEVHSPVE